MNSIDASKVSVNILNISLSLGQLQGRVEEKGYTKLSKDMHESCQDVETYELESTLKELKGMKKSLTEIYKDITTVQTNCLNITDSNIKIIFDKQIEYLHEKRAILRVKLRELYQIVSAHNYLNDALSEAQELVSQSLVSRKGLSTSDIREIENRSNDLETRMASIFEGKSSCKEHFSKSHKSESDLINARLKSVRNNLFLQNEKITKDASTRIESLLDALNNLRENFNEAESKKSIQLNFTLLPSDLQVKFLEIAEALPENYSSHANSLSQIKLKNNDFDEQTCILERLMKDGAPERREYEAEENRKKQVRLELALLELKGDQSFSEFPEALFENPKKAIEVMIETLNFFPDYCEEKEPNSLTRSASRKILNFVTKFGSADGDSPNPASSLGSDEPSSRKNRKKNPSSLKSRRRATVSSVVKEIPTIAVESQKISTGTDPRLDFIIESEVKSAEAETPPVLQQSPLPPTCDEILKSLSERSIVSLDVLKDEVKQIDEKTHLTNEEKETIAKAMIESAEKNRVALDGSNRVYYWVWFIANNSIRGGARGNNYGKVHAPKDIKRLLQAIECTEAGKFCELH